MDKDKEAIFDALDIIRKNQDESVAKLVKRKILSLQQGKRIDYLMKHPGKKQEVLAEWYESRAVWMHPGLKPVLDRWNKTLADGVCDWCGSEDISACLQDHIIRAANDVIKSVMPKPAKRKKKMLSAEDLLAAPYFQEAMDM